MFGFTFSALVSTRACCGGDGGPAAAAAAGGAGGGGGAAAGACLGNSLTTLTCSRASGAVPPFDWFFC